MTSRTPRPIGTKIVGTLGPASAHPERLAELMDAGLNVCRLNFSHGTHAEHGQTLRMIREIAQRRDAPIVVLGDLCGPKIRLNEVRGEPLRIETGDTLRFAAGNEPGTRERLTTNYPPFLDEVHIGQRIFIDDGTIRLVATERHNGDLLCTCLTGGDLRSRKGVNLPDSELSTPALTEKDLADLDWAIANGVDYVALSFVRRPEDLRQLRSILNDRRSPIQIIAKIEMAEALQNLDELIALADGVMVARGDLGVEIDLWRVPLIQKEITRKCRAAGKPVIVATQMLQSMVASPTPTRAEVSDVANAILDRADAVMLSAETAVGQFPVHAVALLRNVAQVTEEALSPENFGGGAPDDSISASNPITAAIANAAVRAALSLNVRAVAVWSATGATVRMLTRARLPMPVIGMTHDERVWRQLNLLYGVVPLGVPALSNPAQMANLLDAHLIQRGVAGPGDLVVVVTSTRPTTPGATDTVLVHRIRG